MCSSVDLPDPVEKPGERDADRQGGDRQDDRDARLGIGGLLGGIGGVLVTKAGGRLFDYYGALGQIQTGYMIMFSFCALAYLVAWGVMKLLIPAAKVPPLPAELANAT